jgi:hypothetical protein
LEYIGHIVANDGVLVDAYKIEAMKDWPHPKTIKILHGFLGLMGYYRKFFQKYGKIAAPLTSLLKKNAFILPIPEFTKTSFLEYDALGKGIGEVLLKDGKPLAFTRKQLSERHLGKSIYEK